MDPKALLQSQGISPEQLAELQNITSRIKARITFRQLGLGVELSALDAEATREAVKIAAGLATQVANTLWTLFGIRGEIVKVKEP